jgi:hypothetical protein
MLRRLPFASALFLVLAIALTWPAALHVGRGVPADFGDPLLNTWLFWWNARAVPLTEAWWNAPAFHPSPDVLAFSEHLLGFAWFTSPLLWLGVSPLAVYTLALLATYVTAGLGAWLLARALTGRDDAAILAGVAFMAAPYRAAQVSHVQVLMACWMPVVLLALHRYLESRRPRWLALFAGAWLLQGLTNGYYLVFLSILVGLWIAYFACRRRSWRAAASIAAASVVVAASMLPFLLKYRAVHEHFGFRRLPEEISRFSADLLSLLQASPHLLLWGGLNAFPRPEGELFPGVALVGIVVAGAAWHARGAAPLTRRVRIARMSCAVVLAAAAALLIWYGVHGRWRVDVLGFRVSMLNPRRPFLAAAVAGTVLAVTWPGLRAAWRRRSPLLFYTGAAGALFLLALGPTPTVAGTPLGWPGPYAWLQQLPGFSGLRVPARLWMPALACLSASVALAWARLPIPPGRRALLACVAGALLVAEGLPAGVRIVAPPSAWPSIVRTGDDVPIVQVPALGTDGDTITMYRAMDPARRLVAGYSGYFPPSWFVMGRAIAEQDPSVLDSLAALGPADVLLDRWSDRRGRWGRWLREQPLRAPARVEGRFTLYPLAARPGSRRPAQVGPRLPVASVSATIHDTVIRDAIDGRLETAWFTTQQVRGDTITIDLGAARPLGVLRLWQARASLDYSRGLAIERSDDGVTWTIVREGSTAGAAWQAAEDAPIETPLAFALDGCSARYVRLRQTVLDVHRWAIHELAVYAPADGSPPCASGDR